MRVMLIILALLFAQEPPRLYVVSARDEVYPGQIFTVTITQFGDVGNVTFDSGGLEVLTDTLGLPTRYVWLRANGVPRDVRVRAWAAGIEASTTIRVCCKTATFPIRPMYLPSVLYTKQLRNLVYLPAIRSP